MKVALAFWGLTRSLKYTIKSIKENILDILKKNNIEYHIYIHTYSISDDYNNVRAQEKNIKLDNNEYKLLNPYFAFVDSQNHIKAKLNLNRFRSHPDPWKTNYKTFDNFILAMFSKLKVTLFIERHGVYDYIIFLRPDVKYLNKFDINYFNLVNDNTACIPDFHLFSNFNDRFFLSNYKNGLLYGKLFNELLEYSKLHSTHSETFNNHFIRNVYKLNVKLIPFHFNRVRADGREQKDTN